MDNMKCNNFHIMGIAEREESEQGIKNLFEEIMTKAFLDLEKEKDIQVQEAHRVPSRLDQRAYTKTHHN